MILIPSRNTYEQYPVNKPIQYSYENNVHTENRSFDLFKILSTLYQRKWIVLFTTLFFSLLALIISSFMKPAYRASATLEIAIKPYEVVEFGKIFSEISGVKNFYNTEYGLLKSRALAHRVIQELQLTSTQLSLGHSNKTDKNQKNSGKIDIEKLFLSYLTISPTADSRLVSISYENANPQLASLITNAIAKNFIQSNIEKKRSMHIYTQEYLSERVYEAQRRLEASEIHLNDYASKNGIIKTDEANNTRLGALKKLEEMLAEAYGGRIEAESNNKHTQKTITNNSVIEALKKEKAQLISDYRAKLQTFKPSYPEMLRLQEHIEQLAQEISVEIQSILLNKKLLVNTEYTVSKDKVAMLTGKVQQRKDELISLQNKMLQYNNIKRQVESDQELYNTLLKRLNEVTVVSQAAVNNISLISTANVPTKKIRPNKGFNLAAGTFLGLAIGSLLALLLEVTRGRIRDEKDLKQLTSLPILGSIPEERKGLTTLAIYKKSSPLMAEAIRSLRTNLMYASENLSPRSILLTSPSKKEGKSTIAINLACAYALTGKTVLLIDADLRKPSIGKQFFNKEPHLGLSNYLKGQAKIVDITKLSHIPRLYVMPAGGIPEDPVELLGNKKMKTLLTLAMQKFDMVIVDSSPILDISDAVVLSKFVDATLLTVKINKTLIDDLSHSIERINYVCDNLSGIVATHTKPKQKYHHYEQKRRVGAPRPKLVKILGRMKLNLI